MPPETMTVDLGEASNHVHYELLMLYWTAVWTEEADRAGHTFRASAYLEAFLIHARSLYQFLHCRPQRKKSDIHADCFMPSGEPWVFPPWPEDRLPEFADRISKYLAHLTVERVNAGESVRRWDVGLICRAIGRSARYFTQKADPYKLGGQGLAILHAAVELTEIPIEVVAGTATSQSRP